MLKILEAAWDVKKWPGEQEKREAHKSIAGIIRDTVRNLKAGEPVTGGPTLEEMEPGMVKRLCRYWGWDTREQRGTRESPDGEREDKRNQSDRLIQRCS